MKILELNKIEKLFFSSSDISKAFGISTESARVAAHRYIRSGILVRIKPNIFVIAEKWKNFSTENLFEAANLMQVPSYISLTTALEYYGLTTQIQRNFIESISIRRTFSKEINGKTFRFSKIYEELYFAFEKREGFYIALPEKALLDSLYLTSLGRYSLDIPAVSKDGLNQETLIKMSGTFPERTNQILRANGIISQT